MLRKNVAGQFVHIAAINATTGAALTSATISIRRCLDGTFAAGGATITEDTGLGFYKVALTQADTNGNDIAYFFTATNMIPICLNVVTTACDPTSTAFGLSLAKNTNITGFNDIAATAIVSSGAITTSGGAVSTVSSVTAAVTLPNIPANWITAAGINADAITAAKIADGAIDRATFAADTGLQSIRSNTAQAGGATSITLDASASATTDFYKNALIVLTGGTGVGQGRYCTAYNGGTKVATVSAWAVNPDATSTFAIIAADAIVGATAPTAAAVATAVWSDLTAGSDFTTGGSVGKLLVDNVNATISSRSTLDAAAVRTAVGLASANLDTQLGTLATSASLTTVGGNVTSIKTKTDNLPADTNTLLTSTGVVLTAAERAATADALLGRNVSGGSSTGRTVKQALHFIRNKWVVAAGTLTVYDTDDSTSSWTSSVTGTAGADPVTGSDPA